jgi:hypothetical protein
VTQLFVELNHTVCCPFDTTRTLVDDMQTSILIAVASSDIKNIASSGMSPWDHMSDDE